MGGVVDFIGSAVAMAAAGAVVEALSNDIALTLAEVFEACPSRQELTEQAVRVFVGATFPSVVRDGEEDLGMEFRLQLFEAMELGAVVGGDRMDGMRFARHDLAGPLKGLLASCGRQFAQPEQPAFALHHSYDARLSLTVHRIYLPVSYAIASIDLFWPLRDRLLPGSASTVVVPPIPLAPLLAGSTEVPPERSSGLLVRPYPDVDGLVAHRLYPLQS